MPAWERLLGFVDPIRLVCNWHPAFGVRPPHCLKKNGTPDLVAWSRKALAQAGSIGRAPAPDSPVTMT